MFTNCEAITIYHQEEIVNHKPIFSRHIIRNVYWEASIGGSQSGKEMQQSDSIYVCIPAKSVTDYVPAREDILCRGIVPADLTIQEIQTSRNKHTITAVADCRYGSPDVQHIEVCAN